MFIRPLGFRQSGGPPYETTGVVIDGTNYFSKTGFFAADSQFITALMSIRLPGFSSADTNRYLGGVTGSNRVILRYVDGGAGTARMILERLVNTAGTSMFTTGAVNAVPIPHAEVSAWHAAAWVINCATGNTQFWYNGSNITLNGEHATGIIDIAGLAARVGNWFGESNDGFEISHFWATPAAIDLSILWSSFFDGDNQPIDLGADGSGPTGSQPEIWAPDGRLTTNLGSGANWTEVGTVPDSATSPTD